MIRRLLPSPADLEGPEDLEAFYELPPVRHLRADFVVSLDGAAEIEGRSGPLGAPADREAFMAMRAVADAVMVGAGTVRAENYGTVKLPAEVQDRREKRGQHRLPPLVMVSRRGLLDPAAKCFAQGEPPIVMTTGRALAEHPELREAADAVECGAEEVDLRFAVDHLGGRGLQRVLCEGGPSLLNSLIAANLVDEMCVTISPLMAGPQRLHLSGGHPFEHPVRFRLEALLEGDGMLLGRYRRSSEQ
ncbi:MAG TPA: pyrimidine reductase family protein [Acidimicrobiales bacterium]|nr:pyrimidine reductase family protein [Acidimicrobiales bacterium]